MRILCFESGGTKLVAALADDSARLEAVRRVYRRPEQTAEETVQALLEMGRELAADEEIAAVGFGFGGTVSRDGFPVHCFHEPGWGSLDAPKIFGDALGVPVFIENDCNLAALAEAWCGSESPDRSLLYVTLGTGVGGGFALDGKPFRSGAVGEVEIGHLVVDPSGFSCPCGNRGCLEQYCSGPGLEQLAQVMTGRAWKSPDLMTAFVQGHEEAAAVVRRASQLLAQGLAAAVNLLAAEQVVLGGGLVQQGESSVHLVDTSTRALVFPPFAECLRPFRTTRLGIEVVCRGAAVYALQRLGRWPPAR